MDSAFDIDKIVEDWDSLPPNPCDFVATSCREASADFDSLSGRISTSDIGLLIHCHVPRGIVTCCVTCVLSASSCATSPQQPEHPLAPAMARSSLSSSLVRSPSSSTSSSVLLLLVLFVPSLVLGRHEDARAASEENAADVKKLLERVVTAVEGVLGFFSQDYSSINVDGLFGMRAAQGQLLEAQKECESGGSCPEELQGRLQAMVDEINRAAEAAMAYVKEEDQEYYRKFVLVIDRPFELPYTRRTLQHLSSTPPGSDASYEEAKGDACMARIMGTFRDEASGRTVEECNVTQACWDMMTKEGTCKYAITHQLIYFSFIQKQGCTETVETAMKAKVSQTQERMCGSIYNEAVREAMDDKVPDIFQDLFLEQVLVCGTLGFENFMRPDWMLMVMTWQKPAGCFSVDSPALLAKEKELVKAQEEERELMNGLKQEANMIEQQIGAGRKLLRERIMQDGCLSHKSGLAFGAMSIFARYLVHQNFFV